MLKGWAAEKQAFRGVLGEGELGGGGGAAGRGHAAPAGKLNRALWLYWREGGREDRE